jgi:hypothetical protein
MEGNAMEQAGGYTGKKGGRTWICILSFILLSVLLFPAKGYAKTETIVMDATVGFDNNYRLINWTPVIVDLENKGDDIDGRVEVLVSNSQISSTLYTVPAVLPRNSKKRIHLYINPGTMQRNLEIKLAEGKKVLKTVKTSGLNPLPAERYFLGVLTEDHPSLTYWWDQSSNNQVFNNLVTVRLDKESFPVRKEIMDNFGVVVINNFDGSQLSAEQRKALYEWIESGRIVILGTGANGRKTMKLFHDDLLPLEVRELVTAKETDALEELASKEMPDSTPLSLADMESQKGEVILEDQGIAVIQAYSVGDGTILVAAFDLGLKPIVDWAGNKLLWENVLLNHVSSSKWTDFMNMGYNRKFDRRMQYNGVLSNIPAMDIPAVGTLLVILLVYLVVVGPVNYIILKKVDKRDWAWITIPALVLVFSAGIFAFGYRNKGGEAIVNAISIVKLQDKGSAANVDSYVGIFIPKKGDYTFTLDRDVLPSLNQNDYWDGPYPTEGNTDTQVIDAKITQGGKASLEVMDASIWTMRTFELSDTIKEFGRLECDLYAQEGHIKGTITNRTHRSIGDILLFTDNGYQKIGDLAVGQSAEVNLKLDHPYSQGYPSQSWYQMLDQLYPYMERGRGGQGDMTLEERREHAVKRQMLDATFSMDFDRGLYTPSLITFIGWSGEQLDMDIEINGEKAEKKYHQTLITGKLSFETERNGKLYIPAGVIRGELDQEASPYVQVNPDGFYVDQGTGVFDIRLEDPQRYDIHEIHVYVGRIYGQGKYRLYNHTHEEWEEIPESYKIEKSKITDFLSKEGRMRLMVEPQFHNNMKEPLSIRYPTISVKGVVR